MLLEPWSTRVSLPLPCPGASKKTSDKKPSSTSQSSHRRLQVTTQTTPFAPPSTSNNSPPTPSFTHLSHATAARYGTLKIHTIAFTTGGRMHPFSDANIVHPDGAGPTTACPKMAQVQKTLPSGRPVQETASCNSAAWEMDMESHGSVSITKSRSQHKTASQSVWRVPLSARSELHSHPLRPAGASHRRKGRKARWHLS